MTLFVFYIFSKKAENALNTPELEKCLSEDSAIKDTQRRRQPVVKRRSSSRLASIKHVQDAEERQQISVKIAESAKQVKDIFSSASKRQVDIFKYDLTKLFYVFLEYLVVNS